MMRTKLGAILMMLAAQISMAGEPSVTPEEINALVPKALRYTAVEIPQAENALIKWCEAIEKRVPQTGEVLARAVSETTRPGGNLPGGEGEKLIREWVAANGPALELMDLGNSRGRCRVALQLEGPQNKALRELARMRVCKSMILLKDGDAAGAAAQAKSAIESGELLLGADGDMITLLIARAIVLQGEQQSRAIARNSKTSEAVLAGMLDAVGRDLSLRHLSVAFRLEFNDLVVQPLVRAAAQSGPMHQIAAVLEKEPSQNSLVRCQALLVLNPKVFDLRETMKLSGRLGEHCAQMMERPWPEGQRPLVEIAEFCMKWDDGKAYEKLVRFWQRGSVWLPEGVVEKWRDATKESEPDRKLVDALTVNMSDEERKEFEEVITRKPNAFGEMRLAAIIAVYPSTYADFCRGQAERVATRTLIALQIYKRRKGGFPENLEALKAEQILHAVPIDPFSGKALKYSMKDERIWSVFNDEVDDGGVTGKDLVWDVNR